METALGFKGKTSFASNLHLNILKLENYKSGQTLLKRLSIIQIKLSNRNVCLYTLDTSSGESKHHSRRTFDNSPDLYVFFKYQTK